MLAVLQGSMPSSPLDTEWTKDGINLSSQHIADRTYRC